MEKGEQFNGRFFSNIRYDNPLSTRIARELGMHVGSRLQALTIQLRKEYPFAEQMIERMATRYYMDAGLDESAARLATTTKGIPDEVADFAEQELKSIVPVGVNPTIEQGFINVKNPLVLETDMINWNPAKFLGGSDISGNLKLSEQAQTFIDAIDSQVKLPEAEVTRIVDKASANIESVIRKKDMNSGKLLNSVYDHKINKLTRGMLEDLGFDSIKYTNMGR